MAGDTNRSYRTVNSNAATPSVSSGLLESGSWSNYTSLTNEVTQPSVTSTESTAIQQEWYETLHASVLEHWANARDLFTEPSRRFLGKKLEAILRCLCLPCTVLVRTLDEPRRHFRPHIGIMYLYMYLCVTVVLNLMVVLTPTDVGTAECIHKSFVIASMFLAIFCMWHLYRFTYRTAEFPRSRGGLFRAFYQGGIRIFGFLSLGYSVAVVIGFVKCGTDKPGVLAASEVLNVVVAATKAIFILVQIVFLHFFYEARIPEESPHVEIIVAHLFGNNLALWVWTLISEEDLIEISTACLGGSAHKYFLPLFVEFLLLAASLFYEIWKNSSTRDQTMSLLQRYIREQRNLPDNTADSISENGTYSSSITRETPGRYNPKSCLGVIIGGSFAALFLVLVIFAKADLGGSDHYGYHIAYSVGGYILYLAQMCACYICQVSLQSHQLNPKHLSLDHEDILLYFSLMGIVLWRGFPAYTILLSGFDHVSGGIDFVGDILAIVQQLFQTVTLVKLRRYKGTQGQCSIWICECIWFLLVTNLTLWVQASFFIELDITTPGERYNKLQYRLPRLGAVRYIVHPLSIFYRFHSAVCCVLARPLYQS